MLLGSLLLFLGLLNGTAQDFVVFGCVLRLSVIGSKTSSEDVTSELGAFGSLFDVAVEEVSLGQLALGGTGQQVGGSEHGR